MDPTEVQKQNEITQRAIAKDKRDDALLEKRMKSQRELIPGRNFLWNTFRYKTEEDQSNYRQNFDATFPNAPGAGI